MSNPFESEQKLRNKVLKDFARSQRANRAMKRLSDKAFKQKYKN